MPREPDQNIPQQQTLIDKILSGGSEYVRYFIEHGADELSHRLSSNDIVTIGCDAPDSFALLMFHKMFRDKLDVNDILYLVFTAPDKTITKLTKFADITNKITVEAVSAFSPHFQYDERLNNNPEVKKFLNAAKIDLTQIEGYRSGKNTPTPPIFKA